MKFSYFWHNLTDEQTVKNHEIPILLRIVNNTLCKFIVISVIVISTHYVVLHISIALWIKQSNDHESRWILVHSIRINLGLKRVSAIRLHGFSFRDDKNCIQKCDVESIGGDGGVPCLHWWINNFITYRPSWMDEINTFRVCAVPSLEPLLQTTQQTQIAADLLCCPSGIVGA